MTAILRKGDVMERPRYPRTVLATCCVPWNDDGAFAEDIFRESVQDQISNGVRDLYIFGTAGEGYAVSERQFDEVTRVFRKETRRDDLRPMVGIISLSLTTVIERIERGVDMGFTTFQLSLPSWGALSDRELHLFFDETCSRFPDCQFLHYNLARAGRLVTPEEYWQLADRHPNLVATKNSAATNHTVIELLAQAGSLRHFFTEFGYSYGSLVGECGLLASIASVSWRRLHDYADAGVRQDRPRLTSTARDLASMSTELQRTASAATHIDGAFDKVFSKIHNPRFPLRLLPPYEGISDHEFERFHQILRAGFSDWLEG